MFKFVYRSNISKMFVKDEKYKTIHYFPQIVHIKITYSEYK